MIALAPMLSAIFGAIFLKEKPDRNTLVAIAITFLSVLYIFYDSVKLGNIFGDILGFITACGLAAGATIIRAGKSLNLVPSAVVGKLVVALVALFFIDTFELKDNDIYIIPAMCILCVAIPFVLVTLAPRYITGAEVNLFFLMETVLGRSNSLYSCHGCDDGHHRCSYAVLRTPQYPCARFQDKHT